MTDPDSFRDPTIGEFSKDFEDLAHGVFCLRRRGISVAKSRLAN
jgi:hypothetical protein